MRPLTASCSVFTLRLHTNSSVRRERHVMSVSMLTNVGVALVFT